MRVSPLCLGTMMFGAATDENVARDIVSAAREHGVNFIDTANAYNAGRSEEIVGRAILGQRDQWIVATKVGNAMGPGPNDHGLSRRAVVLETEHSLRRLGTDRIDLLYLHIDDHQSDLQETLSGVETLVRDGKVLHFGVSNFRGWRIAEVVRQCSLMGISQPTASQPYYNAVNRMPETEILPACQHYDLGVVAYSPLARGVLTGKYSTGDFDPSSRAGRRDARIYQTEMRPESIEIARRIGDHAAAKGFGAAHFAFAWVMRNRCVTAALGGPRTREQWDAYVHALDYPWAVDDEALVDSLVAPGHPSTPGYNDPLYPITGRQAAFSPAGV